MEDAVDRPNGTGAPPLLAVDADRVVDRAIARYLADRRDRIDPFIDRHFTLSGTLRLHRHAFGWDVVKAPANLALAAPQVGLKLSARLVSRLGAKRAGTWLDRRDLMLVTAVGREVAWQIQTDFLELPHVELDRRGRVVRESNRDALAETILSDPAVDAAVRQVVLTLGRRAEDPAFRAQLAETLGVYAGSRTAANEIVTAMMTAGVGAAAFKDFTPSALSLGPLLAATMAQQAAIASFPLGTGLGGVWYGVFPVAPSAGLTLGVTGGLMGVAAAVAAFAGIVSDPVQRKLGLHRRRLERLVAAVEGDLRANPDAKLVLRDAYVARLLDLIDVLRGLQRLAT